MPRIPVNINDLPTEVTEVDESIVYRGVVRAIKVSEEPDKNGNGFLTGIRIEIIEPEEWRGRNAFDNYIQIPEAPLPDASPADRRKAEEGGVRLARFVKAFRVPFGEEFFDTDDALGCEGEFTVKNEEYQGRRIPRVQDYLL